MQGIDHLTIDRLIVDMDGVLWHGDTPVPGLTDFFATLDALDIPFVLATNNAMRVADQYTEKLARFGVAVAPERILTSSEATASYLRRTFPEADRVYVVGESGLARAVLEQGFEVLGPAEVRSGARAPLVVAGLTRDALSYELLAMANILIRQGARFVATNHDATFPTEIGQLPGAGAIVSFLETSTGETATVIGKPNPHMFEEALVRLGGSAQGVAVVGDRLQTDIAGGKAAGLQTIMVLSGISTREDIETSGIRPDAVVQDITELARALRGR
ncbi:MAG: HAD-IIA family hydrolase [Trueperaceae bacterium]|nr:MAG: HAD-IIA family hydrolase [Trueperaceae bacterium]